MKRFSLIEQDRYINIDNNGIFFDENNWLSPDIKNLWAIQWKDNGTPEGSGEIEYDSPIPNSPCTIKDIEKYVSHFNKEYNKQIEIRRKQEEEEIKRSASWQQAMQELESQMAEMQQRHEESLELIQKETNEQINIVKSRSVKEQEKQINILQTLHEKTLAEIQEETAKEIERVHHKVAQDHELLFYSDNDIDGFSEYERVFEVEPAVDVSLFEGDIDPSPYEESIDKEYFDTDEEYFDTDEVLKVEDSMSQIVDFNDLDLSVLESEFSLEMLFDEDSSEQIVPEIEDLISNSIEKFDADENSDIINETKTED